MHANATAFLQGRAGAARRRAVPRTRPPATRPSPILPLPLVAALAALGGAALVLPGGPGTARLAGAMLTALAVAALGRSLARRPGFAGGLAALAAGAAVLSAAILAAGSVADAATTGRVVGTLVHAVVGIGGSSAFLVADGVRWCAEALSTVVGLFQGLALVGLGLSAALGRDGSRILGLLGAAAGATILAAGLVRAHAGFPGEEDPRFLVPAVVVGTAFLVGLALRAPGRGRGGRLS